MKKIALSRKNEAAPRPAVTDKHPETRAGAAFFCLHHNYFVKVMAIILVIAFGLQEVGFAADHPIDLRQFSIPRNIGTTKEVNIADSKDIIINIKDAHDNLSAQESIVSLLDNLVTNYDINLIAVEGSSGYIDTSIISSFPDKEIKTKLASELMAEGMVSASEYFSIAMDSEVALYGIDDKALHAENMEAFRKVLFDSAANYKKAQALYNALAALEDHIYSKDLKELENNSVLKNNGNVGFTKRWDVIRAIGERNGVKPQGFTNINNLLRAIALEKKCDFESTNTEREKLLGVLKNKLDKNRLEELILKSLSFKLGKISASMFYSHLVDTAKAAGIDMRKYPNILMYVEYTSLYESIDIGAIKDEVAAYEAKIKDKLFRNKDERRLSDLLKKASILSDLLEIKLTSGSLKYYQDNKARFSAAEFADFIRSMYAKCGIAIPAGLDITAIFDSLEPSEKFYELTLARNSAMVENTIATMRKRGQTVAALVTGGFHTQGIADILKSDKISYLVILPKFDKDKKRPYITIITNNKQPYQELLDSGELHIALETFFGKAVFDLECMNRLMAFLDGKSLDVRLATLKSYIDRFEKTQQARIGELGKERVALNIARARDFLSAYEAKVGAAKSAEKAEMEKAKAEAEKTALLTPVAETAGIESDLEYFYEMHGIKGVSKDKIRELARIILEAQKRASGVARPEVRLTAQQMLEFRMPQEVSGFSLGRMGMEGLARWHEEDAISERLDEIERAIGLKGFGTAAEVETLREELGRTREELLKIESSLPGLIRQLRAEKDVEKLYAAEQRQERILDLIEKINKLMLAAGMLKGEMTLGLLGPEANKISDGIEGIFKRMNEGRVGPDIESEIEDISAQLDRLQKISDAAAGDVQINVINLAIRSSSRSLGNTIGTAEQKEKALELKRQMVKMSIELNSRLGKVREQNIAALADRHARELERQAKLEQELEAEAAKIKQARLQEERRLIAKEEKAAAVAEKLKEKARLAEETRLKADAEKAAAEAAKPVSTPVAETPVLEPSAALHAGEITADRVRQLLAASGVTEASGKPISDNIIDAIMEREIPIAVLQSREKARQLVLMLDAMLTRRAFILQYSDFSVEVYFVHQSRIDSLALVGGIRDPQGGLSFRAGNRKVIFLAYEERGDILTLGHELIHGIGQMEMAAKGGAAIKGAPGSQLWQDMASQFEKDGEGWVADGWTVGEELDATQDQLDNLMVRGAISFMASESASASRVATATAPPARVKASSDDEKAAEQAMEQVRAQFSEEVRGEEAGEVPGATEGAMTPKVDDVVESLTKKGERGKKALLAKLAERRPATVFQVLLDSALTDAEKSEAGTPAGMSTREMGKRMRKIAVRLVREANLAGKGMMEKFEEWARDNPQAFGEMVAELDSDKTKAQEDLAVLKERIRYLQTLSETYNTLAPGAQSAYLNKLKEMMGIESEQALLDRIAEVTATQDGIDKRIKRIDRILKAKGTEKGREAIQFLAWARHMTQDSGEGTLQAEYKKISAMKDATPENKKSKDELLLQWIFKATAIFGGVFTIHQGEGWEIRPNQALNALLINGGYITNMGTGQGKTFSIALANYLNSFSGKPTDVLLKDDATAARDFAQTSHMYELLGISCGLITQDMNMAADGKFYAEGDSKKQEELIRRKREQTSKMIRYLSPTFIFDIEHDLTESLETNRYFTRDLYTIVIDEVDSLFMDQSRTEFIQAVQGMRATFVDKLGYQMAGDISGFLLKRLAEKTLALRSTAEDTESAEDLGKRTSAFVIRSRNTGTYTITATGRKQIDELIKQFFEELSQSSEWSDIAGELRRMTSDKDWKKRVEIGLDYILNNTSNNFIDAGAQAIAIIDETTGRHAKGQTWQGGMDQMARVIRGLDVNTEGMTMAKLTLYDVLVAFYNGNVAGTSGTAWEGRKEFKKRLGAEIAYVCDHEEYLQRLFTQVHCRKGQAFPEAIKMLIEARRSKNNQPVVVERIDTIEATEWAYMTCLMVEIAREELNMEISPDEKKAMDKIGGMLDAQGIALDELKNIARKTYVQLKQDRRVENAVRDTLAGISIDKQLQTLTAVNEPNEKGIVEKAGENGMITFVTNIAGRATDIELLMNEKIKIIGVDQQKTQNLLGYIEDRVRIRSLRAHIKEELEAIRLFAQKNLSGSKLKDLLAVIDEPIVDETNLVARLNGLGITADVYNRCVRTIGEYINEADKTSAKCAQAERESAGFKAIGDQVIAFTEDSEAMRKKDPRGDFTKETKDRRDTALKGLIKGIGQLDLEAGNKKILEDLLCKKYVYGLLFIGQKSSLRRTDKQGHGRPARAGDPGEYREIVEHGDMTRGGDTAELRMLFRYLAAVPSFKLTEFEEHIEEKVASLKDKARRKLFEDLKKMTGPQLFERYLDLRAKYFGFQDVIDEMGRKKSEIAEKQIQLLSTLTEEERDRMQSEIDRLIKEQGDLEKVEKRYRDFGATERGIKDIYAPEGSPDALELQDTLDQINQIFYAAQMSREENEMTTRIDMDNRSVLSDEAFFCEWMRKLKSESTTGLTVEMSGVIEAVMKEYGKLINENLNDPAKLAALLKEMGVTLNARMKQLYRGFKLDIFETNEAISKTLEAIRKGNVDVNADSIQKAIIGEMTREDQRDRLKAWKMSAKGDRLNLEQIKAYLPHRIITSLVGGAWSGIKKAKKEGADEEARKAIGGELEYLRLSLERVFNISCRDEDGTSLITLDAVSKGSIQGLTKKALVEHLMKVVFDKFKNAKGVALTDDEALYAIDLILQKFLTDEQAIRGKWLPWYGLRRMWMRQKTTGKAFQRLPILGRWISRKLQMRAISGAFLTKRGERYERLQKERADMELGDTARFDEAWKRMSAAVAATKPIEAEGVAGLGRGPPAERLRTFWRRVLRVTERVGNFFRARTGRERMAVFEVITGMGEHERSLGLVKGQRPQAANVTIQETAESRDKVVEVRYGVVETLNAKGELVESDSTDLLRMKERKKAIEKAKADAQVAMKGREDALKGREIETRGKKARLVSDRETQAATPADVVQALAVNGMDRYNEGDCIIYITGASAGDPDKDKETALALKVLATHPSDAKGVTVYVVDRAAAVTTGKVDMKQIGQYQLTAQGATEAAKTYYENREVFPGLTRQGFASGVNSNFEGQAYGWAPVLGRRVLFSRKPAIAGKEGVLEVVEAGDDVNAEDLEALSDLRAFQSIGIDAMRAYMKEQAFGKKKDLKPKGFMDYFKKSSWKSEEGPKPDPDKERLLANPLIRGIIDSGIPVKIDSSDANTMRIGERKIAVAGLAQALSEFSVKAPTEIILKPMTSLEKKLLAAQRYMITNPYKGGLRYLGVLLSMGSLELVKEKLWKNLLKKAFYTIPPEDSVDERLINFAYLSGTPVPDARPGQGDGLLAIGIEAAEDAREKGIDLYEKEELQRKAMQYLQLSRTCGANDAKAVSELALLYRDMGEKEAAERAVAAAFKKFKTDKKAPGDDLLSMAVDIALEKGDFVKAVDHGRLITDSEKTQKARQKIFRAVIVARAKGGYFKRAWDDSWTKKIIGDKGWKSSLGKISAATSVIVSVVIWAGIATLPIILATILVVAILILLRDFVLQPNYKDTKVDKFVEGAGMTWKLAIGYTVKIPLYMMALKLAGSAIALLFPKTILGGLAYTLGITLGIKIAVVVVIGVVIWKIINNLRDALAKDNGYRGDLRRSAGDRMLVCADLLDNAIKARSAGKEKEANDLLKAAQGIAFGRYGRGRVLPLPPHDPGLVMFIARFYYLQQYDDEKDKDKKAALLDAMRDMQKKAARRKDADIDAAAKMIEAAIRIREGRLSEAGLLLSKAAPSADPLKLDLLSIKMGLLKARKDAAKDAPAKNDINAEIENLKFEAKATIAGINNSSVAIPAEGDPDPFGLRQRYSAYQKLQKAAYGSEETDAKADTAKKQAGLDAIKKTGQEQTPSEAPSQAKKEKPYEGTPKERIKDIRGRLKALSAQPSPDKKAMAKAHYDLMLAYEDLDKEIKPAAALRRYTVRPIRWLWRLASAAWKRIRTRLLYGLFPYPQRIHMMAARTLISDLDAEEKLELIKRLLETRELKKGEGAAKYLKICVDELKSISSADNAKDRKDEIDLAIANIRIIRNLTIGWHRKRLRDPGRGKMNPLIVKLKNALAASRTTLAALEGQLSADVMTDTKAAALGVKAAINELVFEVAEYDYEMYNKKLIRSVQRKDAREGGRASLEALIEAAIDVIGQPGIEEKGRLIREKLIKYYERLAGMIRDEGMMEAEAEAKALALSVIYDEAITTIMRLADNLSPEEQAEIIKGLLVIVRGAIDNILTGKDEDVKAMPATWNSILVSLRIHRAGLSDLQKSLKLAAMAIWLSQAKEKAPEYILIQLLNEIKNDATNDPAIFDAVIILENELIAREEAAWAIGAKREYVADGSFDTAFNACLARISALKAAGDDKKPLLDKAMQRAMALTRKVDITSREARVSEILKEIYRYPQEFLLKLLDLDISIAIKINAFEAIVNTGYQHPVLTEVIKKIYGIAGGRMPLRNEKMEGDEAAEDAQREIDVAAIAAAVRGRADVLTTAIENITDMTEREASLVELHNILFALDKIETLKNAAAVKLSDERERVRYKIEAIREDALDKAKAREMQLRQAEYKLHISVAEHFEKVKDFAGAVRECEAAAALFEKAFEEDKSKWIKGDKERAAAAVANVWQAYEDIADLRVRMDDATALLSARQKRDKWIADHWELFDGKTRISITDKHKTDMTGYTLDEEGFHKRFQDMVDDMVRMADLAAEKQLEAAHARADKALEHSKTEQTHAANAVAADKEITAQNEAIKKAAAQEKTIADEITALEAKLEAARMAIAAERAIFNSAHNRNPVEEEIGKIEAKALLEIESLKTELAAKETELKAIRAGKQDLENKNKITEEKKADEIKKEGEASDKKNDLIGKPAILSDAISAVGNCMSVVNDIRDDAEAKAQEAIDMLAALLKLGNADINNEIFRLMGNIEAGILKLSSIKVKKALISRVNKLKIALLKANLGESFNDIIRAGFTSGSVEEVMQFQVDGNVLAIPSGILFEEVASDEAKGANDLDTLRFLAMVLKHNDSNAVAVLAMKRLVDTLYKRLDIQAGAQDEEFNIEEMLKDGAFEVIIRAGSRDMAGTARDIIRELYGRDKNKTSDAWGVLTGSQKLRLIADLLSTRMAGARYVIPDIYRYFDRVTDPFGLVGQAEGTADPYAAIRLCEKALELDQNCQEAIMRMAGRYRELGINRKASEFYKKATATKGPYQKEAFEALMDVSIDLRDSAGLASACEGLAKLALENKEYSKALDMANKALKYAPGDAALLTLKARILVKRGSPDDLNSAIVILGRVLERRSRKRMGNIEAARKDAFGLRAEACFTRHGPGDYAMALRDANRAAKLGYESKDVLRYLALNASRSVWVTVRMPFARTRILKKAGERLRTAIKLSEKPDPDLYRDLIDILKLLKDNDGIVREAQTALDVKGITDAYAKVFKEDIIEAYIQKARGNIRKKKYDEARKNIAAARKYAEETGDLVAMAVCAAVEAPMLGSLKARTKGWWINREKNREKLFRAVIAHVDVLKDRNTLSSISEGIKSMERFLAYSDTRDRAAKEIAGLCMMKAGFAGVNEAEQLELCNRAIVLGGKSFAALARRGLIYAAAGKTEYAVEDLEEAVAMTYGEKETGLAQKALEKLIELKTAAGIRDDAGMRVLENKLEAVKSVLDAKKKKGKAPAEGKAAAEIAEKIEKLAVKETRDAKDGEEMQYYFEAIRAERGAGALAKRLGHLVGNGDIKEAQRALAFLAGFMTSGEEAIDLAKLNVELIERSDRDALDDAIKKCKDQQAQKDKLLIELAGKLGIDRAQEKLRDGTLEKEIDSRSPQNHAFQIVQVMYEGLQDLNKQMELPAAQAVIVSTVGTHRNFISLRDRIKALIGEGSYKVALRLIAELTVSGQLSSQETKALRPLVAEANRMTKEYVNALSSCDLADTREILERARVLLDKGGESEINEALRLINVILKARSIGDIDGRYDDELIVIIGGVIGALRKYVKDKDKDAKVDLEAAEFRDNFESLFWVLPVLFVSADAVMKISAIILIPDLKSVPSGFAAAMLQSKHITDTEIKTILLKIKDMVQKGAELPSALLAVLGLLGRKKECTGLDRLILGYEGYNSALAEEKAGKRDVAVRYCNAAGRQFRAAAKNKTLASEALTGQALALIVRNRVSGRTASRSDNRIMKKAAGYLLADFGANMALGNAFLKDKKYAAAIVAFKKAGEAAKDDAGQAAAAKAKISETYKKKIAHYRLRFIGTSLIGAGGIKRRMADITGLFEADEDAVKDKDILAALKYFASKFSNSTKLGRRRLRADRGLYLSVLVELTRCLVAQGNAAEADRLIDQEYRYIKGRADFLAVKAEAQALLGNNKEAMRWHERACSADASYNRRKSVAMAKVFFVAAQAAGITSEDKLNYLRKAAALDPDNLDYQLALAKTLREEGIFSEAESVLEHVKSIGAKPDATEKDREEFTNIQNQQQRAEIKTLYDTVKAARKDMDLLNEALSLEARKTEIMAEMPSADAKEKIRLTRELDGIIARLESRLEYPKDTTVLDESQRIGKRRIYGMNTPEYKDMYISQLVNVLIGKIKPKDKKAQRSFYIYVLKIVEENIASGRYDVAHELLRLLQGMSADQDNRLRRQLLTAKAIAGEALQAQDVNVKKGKQNAAEAMYRSRVRHPDLRTKYIATIGLVNAELARGVKIENADLDLLDISGLSNDELIKIKDLIPEITALLLRKAQVTKAQKDYELAFNVIHHILFSIDATEPSNAPVIVNMLDGVRTCLAATNLGASDGLVARLKYILDDTKNTAIAIKITALFAFLDTEQCIVLFEAILSQDAFTDQEKAEIAAGTNRQWFERMRRNGFRKPVEDKGPARSAIKLAETLLVSQKKDKAMVRALHSSLGYLALSIGSYESAIRHFKKSDRSIYSMFGLMAAYTGAGRTEYAKATLKSMQQIFGRYYPDLIRAAELHVAAAEREALAVKPMALRPSSLSKKISITALLFLMPTAAYGVLAETVDWQRYLNTVFGIVPPEVKLAIVAGVIGLIAVAFIASSAIQKAYEAGGVRPWVRRFIIGPVFEEGGFRWLMYAASIALLSYNGLGFSLQNTVYGLMGIQLFWGIVSIVLHPLINREDYLPGGRFDMGNRFATYARGLLYPVFATIVNSILLPMGVAFSYSYGLFDYARIAVPIVQYVPMAIMAHFAFNAIVQAIKDRTGFEFGYATIGDIVKAPASAAIGIVCSPDDKNKVQDLVGLPGVMFIPLVRRAPGEDMRKALADMTPGAARRVLVDLADPNPDEILALAYAVGLSDGNISRLNKDTLKEVFDAIIAALPSAKPLNLDAILTKAFTEDIMSKAGALANKPLVEVRRALAKKEADAVAEYWKGRPGLASALADKISAETPTGKVSVAVFDSSMINRDNRKDFDELVVKSGLPNSRLRVAVIGEGNEPHVTYIRRENGPISVQIRSIFRDSVYAVSVAMTGDLTDPMDDVRQDIRDSAGNAVAYIISKERLKKLVTINLANLLETDLQESPRLSFTIVGKIPPGAFNNIAEFLKQMGIIPRMIKASDAIPAIFNAIKQASISA